MEQIDEVELFCQSLQIQYKSDRKFGFDLNEMSSLEQTDFVNFIRNEFLRLCAGNSFDIIIKFIKAVFLLSEYRLIEEIIPFQIIEDLVEVGSYSVLEQLLPFLDKKSEFWATKLSSKKGIGLILLRSVNSLRRKIIRSEHSKLAGLSLLLISKIFPASERSGVNLRGERNIDNNNLKVLKEVTELKYSSFWTIHELFYSSPKHFSESKIWNKMCENIESILKKIETKIMLKNSNLKINLIASEEFDFFSTQHLMTEESLELQIDEPNFRLSFLSQILILLQDINVSSSDFGKLKAEIKIDENQENWIGESTKKTFYLISLHQFGKEYFRFLRSIFRNEKNWIGWKCNSCPNFEKSGIKNYLELDYLPLLSEPSILISMGDEELGRLCNYSVNDVENRKLKPDIEDYLEHTKPGSNPNCDDYIPDKNLLWRANRMQWKLKL